MAVSELEPSEARLLAAAMGPDADLVEPRLARGSRCFLVRIDRRIAGYGWLSTGPEWIGELQLEIRPQRQEGYVWNCVTMAEHRRQGVFRSILLGVSQLARNEGLRRLWIGSVAIPAERAVGPSGFRPALRFASMTGAGVHVMRVTEEADRELATDALDVLAVRPGLHVRRSRQRRH